MAVLKGVGVMENMRLPRAMAKGDDGMVFQTRGDCGFPELNAVLCFPMVCCFFFLDTRGFSSIWGKEDKALCLAALSPRVTCLEQIMLLSFSKQKGHECYFPILFFSYSGLLSS